VFSKVFFFFRKSHRLQDNVGENDIVEMGRPQMTIWLMRIACCIPEATKTHSEYAIVIAFSTETMVTRTGLTVTLHVHCLSCMSSVRVMFFGMTN